MRRLPSPNFGPRREAARPDLIVLHYTAMKSAEAARRVLSDPAAEVSAHYLIARDGAVLQLVDEEMRAWHAGAGRWGAVADVNSRSVGIELDNDGASPFAEPMMRSLEALLPGVMARWRVPPERVIAHSDCAPGRKIDPGVRFDWRRLALQGLAVWSDARAEGPLEDADALAAALRRIGYTAEVAPEVILASFRLRFRPGACGPANACDLARAADLAARFPVDRAGVWA